MVYLETRLICPVWSN